MKSMLLGVGLFLVAGIVIGGGRREAPPPMMMAPAPEEMTPRTTPVPGKVLYTSLEDAMAVAARGPAVLFFAADWCPTCQAAFRDINANGAALGNVTVIVVDYDTEGELKRRYGVTYQHTFVHIDARGNELSKWSGGGVAEIVSAIDREM